MVDDLVVGEAGISGASRHNRPGFLQLIARIDEWDVVMVTDFSRLARNQEDMGWVQNRLRLHKRTAIEAQTGLDLFNVGAQVMGVMNEQYLVKLRADTQRGLRGRVERGFSGGGCPYGYRSVPVPSGRVDAHGRDVPAGYRWERDEEQAAVVRHIFEWYVAGEGLKAIARRLNRDGVPSPRPRATRRRQGWSFTAIHPLLQNAIYKGEYVWNRSEWIKDHETGSRRRYDRPESEWVRQHDEAWRIVPDALWEAAQHHRAERSRVVHRPGSNQFSGKGPRRGRPRTLLGGFLACGVCGSAIYQLYANKVGCGRHEADPALCNNDLRVPRAEIEDRVLRGVEEQVLRPEHLAYVVEEALAAAERPDRRAAAERELAEVERKVARLLAVAEAGGAEVTDVVARLRERRAERDQLRTELQALRDQAPVDPVQLQTEIEAAVASVRGLLLGDPERGREALPLLFGDERLRLVPEKAKRTYAVVGEARLDWLVAGGGFEPPTSGL